MVKKLRVVSLFSGAGGMDLGFINAGFEIVWANDFYPEAIATYNQNIGDHIVFGDITKIQSNEIPDDIDVIIGGFPCQGFSVSNTNRSMEDKRNFLYKEMFRIIKDKKPSFFVAENVKGLLSLGKGKIIDMIVNDFNSIGYSVSVKVLNAAEYGVPQARERVFIIGNKHGFENPYPVSSHIIKNKAPKISSQLALENLFQEEIQEKKPAKTVKEAIGFLENVRLSFDPIALDDGNIIYNHVASTNVADKFWGRKYDVKQEDICDYLKIWRKKSGWSTSKIDKELGYRHTAGHWFRKDNNSGSIPNPDDWWALKKMLNFDDKFDKQVTTLVEKDIKFEQSLRITNWERPSDTITATGPEIHINKKRRLSVRECAILQTFPEDFIFHGSLNKMYTQVGNAVPVLLAEKIAEGIKKTIIEERID